MSTEKIVDEVVDGQMNDSAHSTSEQPSVEIAVETVETQTPSKNTLYRHPTEKMVGGVCGGLADYFGWDPALVRILWVVVTLTTGGGGFLAYLALWMLLPVGTVSGGQQQTATLELNERNMSRAAYVLIVLGAIWLLANVGVLPQMWAVFWSVMSVFFWPALLIAAGYLLLRGSGKKDWKMDLGNVGQRLRTRVNGKMPTRDDVKGGLKDVKQHLPLKRSRQDRMFMGICGGIGLRLGIDANLVRLIWAAFSIGSIGMGVLVYVLLGFLLPEESVPELASVSMEPHDVQVIDGSFSG